MTMIGVAVVAILIDIAFNGARGAPSFADGPGGLLLGLVVNGLFIAFVVVQKQHLDRGFVALGSKQRAPFVLFLGLVILADVLALLESLPLAIGALLLYVMAYSIWQSTYNDFWRAVRKRVTSAERADVAGPEDLPAHSPT